MIDFRYHLVSLISVFLALAVGIALGAGPLKETIGDTLTGQVDQLREEKDALRAELDEATTELQRTEEVLAAFAPDVLDGVLDGRRVAVVQVAEVDPAVLEEVTARLDQAGAVVSATVQVTPVWFDDEQRAFRQRLAGSLLEYLDPLPADDAGTETELAEALVQALTTAEPTDPDVVSEGSDTMLDLLVEAGLVALAGDVTAPADAVVVLAGPTVSAEDALADEEATATADPDEEAAADAETDARLAAVTEIVVAAEDRSSGAVVASGELVEGGLLTRLRADEDLAERITTVESVHTLTGLVSVPLALGARLGGTPGHYGPGDGATALVPPHVELPPVERVPVVGPPEPGTEGTAEDAAGSEGAEGTDGEGTDAAGTDGGDAAGGGSGRPAEAEGDR